jgi:hypothetical protein
MTTKRETKPAEDSSARKEACVVEGIEITPARRQAFVRALALWLASSILRDEARKRDA